jgi:hypothetical protein
MVLTPVVVDQVLAAVAEVEEGEEAVLPCPILAVAAELVGCPPALLTLLQLLGLAPHRPPPGGSVAVVVVPVARPGLEAEVRPLALSC